MLSGMKDQWHYDLAETFGKAAPAGPERSRRWWTRAGPVAARPRLSRTAERWSSTTARRSRSATAPWSSPRSRRCTNTSNPDVMIGAGLVARKARERGLTRKPWVKTSLAPGLEGRHRLPERQSGLMDDLEALGFYLVGYGCTTCIGNSGPLPRGDQQRRSTSTTSWPPRCCPGNRNFEGRISPDVRANYLASPPLVVAYALAGTVDIDLTTEPIGKDARRQATCTCATSGRRRRRSTRSSAGLCKTRAVHRRSTRDVFEGSEEWRAIATTGERPLRVEPDESTYVQEPPFFMDLGPEVEPIAAITGARVPAASSATRSPPTTSARPAPSPQTRRPGSTSSSAGVEPRMFNSYGSRRGNDRVMTRGTFANIRVRNQLAPGTEGGFTTDFTDGTVKTIYEAASATTQPASRSSCWRARTTAWARRATGRRRARSCSASRPSSPRASSASTAPTSSGWACCR